MDTKFQPSFIPKKPMGTRDFGNAIRNSKIGLFTLLGMVIFIITLGLTGFVYLYKAYTEKDIQKMKIRIEETRAKFQPETIQDLVRTHERVKMAKQILDRHISTTALLQVLADNTYQNVRYKTFSYAFGSDNAISLNMTGEAKSFNSVALQSDRFRAHKLFSSPIFSGLTLNEKSYVEFNFTSEVDPLIALYKNAFEAVSSESESDVPNVNEENTGTNRDKSS